MFTARYTFLFILALGTIAISAQSSYATSFVKRVLTHIRSEVHKDIPYGKHPLQVMDIYTPDERKKQERPVLIFIHGGAWFTGDKKSHDDKAHFYNRNDIILVNINYRLAPQNPHPSQAEDTATAIKWVHDNIHKYGGDPKRIHLSGHSAGAHIAALIGTDERYLNEKGLSFASLKSVIPVDTASFDLNERMDKGGNFISRSIKKNFGEDKSKLEDASPAYHAENKKDFPRFLIFTTAKRPAAAMQSMKFSTTLNKSNGHSDVHIILKLSHGEMNEAMQDPNHIMSKLILDLIKDED